MENLAEGFLPMFKEWYLLSCTAFFPHHHSALGSGVVYDSRGPGYVGTMELDVKRLGSKGMFLYSKCLIPCVVLLGQRRQ